MGELKCPVCDRAFVSDKSLYGHMKHHPDRNWRGMKPPMPGTKGPVLILPGWAKTGWRTSPGKGLTLIPASDQDLSVSDNKGDGLCLLLDGESATEKLPPRKTKLESSVSLDGANSRCPVGNEKLENNGNSSSPSGNDKTANPGPGSSTFVDIGLVGSKTPISARKRHHVCDICDKPFKSYQALGGHKAHHENKAKKISSALVDDDAVARGLSDSFVHGCPFCNKIFSKGQALGGHKRHCRRPANDQPGEGQETRNHSRAFSFDLNELPQELDS